MRGHHAPWLDEARPARRGAPALQGCYAVSGTRRIGWCAEAVLEFLRSSAHPRLRPTQAFGLGARPARAISRGPLDPGDVIVTGTPGGVGSRRNPPVWMAKGDEVEVDISGIGVLRNPIMEE
ncbi:MAG: fumarylacetoacetate hydrolase family protein [Candidatus Rokubacteria bacterium]|nr:fumarylacetoacetate hydrolase family protein [Candidatus Rokubacteria bacterium]